MTTTLRDVARTGVTAYAVALVVRDGRGRHKAHAVLVLAKGERPMGDADVLAEAIRQTGVSLGAVLDWSLAEHVLTAGPKGKAKGPYRKRATA